MINIVTFSLSVVSAHILSSFIITQVGTRWYVWVAISLLAVIVMMLAYTFISGIFGPRAAVVLDILDTECTKEILKIVLRNDGTCPPEKVTISAIYPTGIRDGSCVVSKTLYGGSTGNCTISRAVDSPTGNYRLETITESSLPVSEATATVWCTSST